MKKSILKILSFFIFLCNSTANAQHDFQPGYIVTNNNDTIHGFIDYGISQSNSVSCNFKLDSTKAVTSYSPNELKAYAFSGKGYYLTKNIKTESGLMNYFVECLVNGVISLYYYNYLGIEHYMVEQANELNELKNDEISFVEDGRTYFKKSNQYKGALTYLMKNVPAMSSEIQNTNFNAKSLISLVEKYHKMSGMENDIIYKRQEKRTNDVKWKFNFGISGGVNYSSMKATSNNEAIAYVLTQNTFPPSSVYVNPALMESNIANLMNAPILSASSMTILPGIILNISKNNKNSLQLEFLYIKNKYATNGFTINTNNLVFPVLYKREFYYYKKLKPFVDLGPSLRYDYNMQINNLYAEVAIPELKGNQLNYREVTYYVNKENSNIKTTGFRIGMIGGLGLAYDLKKKNRLELEFRAERFKRKITSNFDDHIFVTSTFRFWNFGIFGRVFI
jgi:hypothetical protein